MKYHLLVAASALVIGLGMTASAFAHDEHDHDPSHNISGAVAISNQDGAVAGVFAKGTVDNNDLRNVNPTGLANIQQNGGANSILQDQNTLGAILDCSCSSSNNSLDVSLAASNQSALVLGAVSIGAQARSENGSSSGAGFHFVSAGGHESSGGHYTSSQGASANSNGSGTNTSGSSSTNEDSSNATGNNSTNTSNYDNKSGAGGQSAGFYLVAAGGGWHHNTWHDASSYQASSNTAANINGTGLMNISQNTGNNSMLQAGNTVAAIVGTGH